MTKELIRLIQKDQEGEVRLTKAFKELDWDTKVNLLSEWKHEIDCMYQTLIIARNAKEK